MNWKKIVTHVIAIVVFLLVSIIYFSPVLDGKKLIQSDMSSYQGASKVLNDYKKTTGKSSEWTPNMFSGMPTYQIHYGGSANVFDKISQILVLGDNGMTIGILFLMALGFYVFMISMGVNPWLSIFAGLMYALGSYNIIIIGVGHITKAWAMSMIAPVLGGMICVYQKKYRTGLIIFIISLGVQLAFNHIQITYYTLITAIIIGISYLCFAIKEKTVKDFLKSTLFLIIGAILAALPATGHLMINNQYAKHTMRGGSELTVQPQLYNKTINNNGLDIDYAFNWSYGKDETMTMLIADYKGGGGGDLRITEKQPKILKNRIEAFQNNAPKDTNPQNVQQVANQYFSSSYWGTQPFTAGTVYFGAIVVFLTLLGFLLLDNKFRWWLLAATVVSVILAWGKNLMWFNSLLFYYLPLYSKFRTPSMALVIANVTMCIAGGLGLKIFLESNNTVKKTKALYISGAIVMIITLLCAVIPSLFTDFTSGKDDVFKEHLGDAFNYALQQDRRNMFVSDSWRSFLFIAISFAVLWLFNTKKIKNSVVVICLIGIFAVADLIGVDLRYLNKSSFRSKAETVIVASESENSISNIVEQQHINHYRVYNLTSNPFNESNTSYFHPSIGGYSPAKLQRYQDLIDFSLFNSQYKQKDITDTSLLIKNPVRNFLYQYKDAEGFPMPNMGVLNMLDTRYLILSDNMFLENTEACGPAWFVNNIFWANSPDDEILALDNFDPKTKVIINKKYKDIVKQINNPDTAATIEFIPKDITKVSYKTKSSTDNIAVFSEIFYNDSWHCYIDGKEVPYFCADYVLRGLYVPKGEHTIDFVCGSNLLKTGRIIGYTGSIIAMLFVVILIVLPFIKKKDKKQILKYNS